MKLETYLNIIIDMTIFVGRCHKLILIACPFPINNVLVLIVSFLVNATRRNVFLINSIKINYRFGYPETSNCIQILNP